MGGGGGGRGSLFLDKHPLHSFDDCLRFRSLQIISINSERSLITSGLVFLRRLG